MPVNPPVLPPSPAPPPPSVPPAGMTPSPVNLQLNPRPAALGVMLSRSSDTVGIIAATIDPTLFTNDLVAGSVDLTINPDNALQVASDNYTFTSASVGLEAIVTGGTGWTPGNYLAVAFTAASGGTPAYVTLDHSPSLATNTNAGTCSLNSINASAEFDIGWYDGSGNKQSDLLVTGALPPALSSPVAHRTDLAVSSASNLLVSSAGTPFGSGDVLRWLNQTLATGGWTAGWYRILDVDPATHIATLDSSPAATGTTGGACDTYDPLAVATGELQVVGRTGTVLPALPSTPVHYTDLTVDETTDTLWTSAAHPFQTADVNTWISVPTGVTGWTAGWYQVTAVNATTHVATVDHSPNVDPYNTLLGMGDRYDRASVVFVGVRQTRLFSASITGSNVLLLWLGFSPHYGPNQRAIVELIDSLGERLLTADLDSAHPFVALGKTAAQAIVAGKTLTSLVASSVSAGSPALCFNVLMTPG